jgi:CTP:molybdopterin cytidylyltransferase MocA
MAPDDKLMLPVQGQPLLRHVAKQVLALKLATHAALPAKPHPRWNALAGLGLSMAAYGDSAEGLAGTLRAAVADLPASVTHLCVVLADLPDIQPQDFDAVFEQVKLFNELVFCLFMICVDQCKYYKLLSNIFDIY